MITLMDLQKAIEKRIKEALKDTEFSMLEPLAEDITENFPRPSIKVRLESAGNGKFNAHCREKTVTVRNYFFAKDRNKYTIDNLEMQELLENAFLDDLEVKEGFFIPIEQVESEVVDTVLQCSFDLYIVELLPDNEENNAEIMDEININLNEN